MRALAAEINPSFSLKVNLLYALCAPPDQPLFLRLLRLAIFPVNGTIGDREDTVPVALTNPQTVLRKWRICAGERSCGKSFRH